MKKMIFILAFGLGGPILAMQKETHITLIGKDNKKINIARETAQRIPTIQDMLTPGFQEAETGSIQFELFDVQTLLHIIGVVRNVYYHAPVLKLDPQFFEQTDKHPAYTPTDIPEQVRNIITAQGLQNNKAFMQVADFLGLDWVNIAMQGGKSIADLITYNQLPQVSNNRLDLTNKNITNVIGLYLLSQDIRDNLQDLWLSHNQIASVPDNAFVGLNNLRWLQLSDNKLTSIAANAFAGLNNLQWLYLGGNELTSITDSVFVGLNNLQQLFLGINKLTSIAANAFAGLNNLQWLYLGVNELTSITDSVFAGLNNLQQLNISNNQLTSIADNAFAGLNNLQYLGLEGNNQLDQETKDRIRQELPGVFIEF